MDYYYTNNKNESTYREAGILRLKVCGMNNNTTQVATLLPDYLGFIFWKPSKRYSENNIPPIPHSIKKVGVFVDEEIKEIKIKVEKYGLLLVQLHGKENPSFCIALKKEIPQVKIIKVFSIKDKFDFSVLEVYEDVCDYYLFDTKGKLPGGNGHIFDWSVLKGYPSTKPYFLSGGIGMENVDQILEFLKRSESQYCHALDINSKFEIEPGLKNIDTLKDFKKLVLETKKPSTKKNN